MEIPPEPELATPAIETPVFTPAEDPQLPSAEPNLSQRLALVDVLLLMLMIGLGQGAARFIQSTLRVAWNYVGTAPWPTYATPNERYLFGALLGLSLIHI